MVKPQGTNCANTAIFYTSYGVIAHRNPKIHKYFLTKSSLGLKFPVAIYPDPSIFYTTDTTILLVLSKN